MIELNPAIAVMNDEDLLASTRELVRKSCGVEAQLLHHLGEIDARALFAQRAFPSMIVFCMKEFGFSEGAAFNRIFVARAARRLPGILEALASGRVHLAGLRILVPHLTEENQDELLAEAAGKSKREIEEIAARLAPKPPVPDCDPEASATRCREGGIHLCDGNDVVAAGRSSPRRRAAVRGDVRIQVHRIARGPGQAAQGAGPSPPSPSQRRSRGRLSKKRSTPSLPI